MTYHIVIRGINVFQQAGRAPPGAEDHQVLLRLVEGKLGAGRPVRLCDIVEDAAGGDDGDQGRTADVLEEAAPATPGFAVGRRGWGRSRESAGRRRSARRCSCAGCYGRLKRRHYELL